MRLPILGGYLFALPIGEGTGILEVSISPFDYCPGPGQGRRVEKAGSGGSHILSS